MTACCTCICCLSETIQTQSAILSYLKSLESLFSQSSFCNLNLRLFDLTPTGLRSNIVTATYSGIITQFTNIVHFRLLQPNFCLKAHTYFCVDSCIEHEVYKFLLATSQDPSTDQAKTLDNIIGLGLNLACLW